MRYASESMIRLQVTLCVVLLLAARTFAAEPDFNFFETKIRPVLVERCYECHGDKKQKAGLRLDSKAALLKGGDSGPIVVPGKPNDSLILTALRYEEPKTPPKAKITSAIMAAFTKRIQSGAPNPPTSSENAAKSIELSRR